MTSPPSVSRPPAPAVAPVVHAGVRYEQASSDERQGDQDGGYLVALGAGSGARLWRLKVYEVPDHRAAGVAMGGIYFRTLCLVPDRNELEIENEHDPVRSCGWACRQSLKPALGGRVGYGGMNGLGRRGACSVQRQHDEGGPMSGRVRRFFPGGTVSCVN